MITLKIFLFKTLAIAFNIYLYIVLVYCVATFFVQKNRYAPWFVFLSDLVEPPLVWIRKIARGHTTLGRFDLSPIILLFSLEIVLRLLRRMAF